MSGGDTGRGWGGEGHEVLNRSHMIGSLNYISDIKCGNDVRGFEAPDI